MGISILPEEFPRQRRDDPKRQAEARVFDALQALDMAGHALYEFRKGGKQVDFALWLDRLARFASQVKGGPYEMDNTGQWFLAPPTAGSNEYRPHWRRRLTGPSRCATPSGRPPESRTSSRGC